MEAKNSFCESGDQFAALFFWNGGGEGTGRGRERKAQWRLVSRFSSVFDAFVFSGAVSEYKNLIGGKILFLQFCAFFC